MNEVQGFLLEDSGIRGALVRLTETWQRVIAQHDYSAPVKSLLGEGVAATVLLASGLKAKPSVSLQLQGEGALKLLLIQCSHELRVRGMAKGNSAAPEGADLLGEGRLVVNVDTGSPRDSSRASCRWRARVSTPASRRTFGNPSSCRHD